MAHLLDITEPNQNKKTNDEFDESPILGIDFGTTNSAVATYTIDGKINTILDVTPSIITFFNDGTHKCFETDENGITISSIKRFAGEGDKIFDIFGKSKTANEITTILFRGIKEKCHELSKAVITVPAYFDDIQRQDIKEAATKAGFEVIKLLAEPTSAALFYNLDKQDNEGIYAVFDLGGGTFDVSILQNKMGIIKVIAVGGNSKLGGDDFDDAFAKANNISKSDAKKIKEELSYSKTVSGFLLDDFDKAVLPLVHSCVDIFKQTLKDANTLDTDLKGIILVGGSTKMPIIKEALKMEFKTKILDNCDPDRVVCFGAAVHADNILFKRGNLLLDVVPLSLGIEVYGGIAEKIIHRNTIIPFNAKSDFSTFEDGQTSILLNIIQGERDMAKDCRSLGVFKLSGIPPMPAGVPKIEVIFSVDASGLLKIRATEKLTNIVQKIEINPNYDLDLKKLKISLEDAMKNAKDDIHAKLLEEKIVEAKATLKGIQNAITDSKIEISQEGVKKVENLQKAIIQKNRDEIHNAIVDANEFFEDIFISSIKNNVTKLI